MFRVVISQKRLFSTISQFNKESFEAIRQKLAKENKFKITDKSKSAVLVPLCTYNNKPSVLFTLRSNKVGTHKGQVSFPGGKREKTDIDEVDNALRETYEEIGVKKESIEVLGTMTDFLSITNFSVTPVVGYMRDFKDLKSLTISEGEIEVPFILSFDELLNPEKIQFETRSRVPGGKPIVMPRFVAHEKYVIWGLTAAILYQFFRVIQIPIKTAPITTEQLRTLADDH